MGTDLVELRRYVLHPGQRDRLVALFDDELVEPQEALGLDVLGQFRDPARPDHFVWLRGFVDLQQRHDALSRFYGGPDWARHADAANATMVAWDDVHLLLPCSPAEALPAHEPSRRERPAPAGSVAVVVHRPPVLDADAVDRFRAEVVPELESTGARTLGLYRTAPGPNTFARLPVHEHQVVVWFGALAPDTPAAAAERIRASTAGAASVLLPTRRSVLDGTSAG